MNDILELTKLINQFREERDWKQFHNPKDLAISLSIEASELLENFQWKSSEESIIKNRDNIQRELADVIVYALMLSDDLDLNVGEIVESKLKENADKYPIDKSKGSSAKYTSF